MTRSIVLNIFLILCSMVANATQTSNNVKPKSNSELAFRENKGQITDQFGTPRSDLLFQFSTPNSSIFIGNNQIHYQWNHIQQNPHPSDSTTVSQPTHKATSYRLDMELLGSNTHPSIIKELPRSDVDIYYTLGLNGTKAHSYQKITYKDIYPNIDWVLYTKDSSLKYDFIVRPGGKVSDIKIHYSGSKDISIKEGAVIIVTPMGSLTEGAPFSYSAVNGDIISSHFILKDNTLSFETGNHEETIVIDPELRLEWGTYYGGTGSEQGQYLMHTFQGYYAFGNTVITDHEGNVYLSGTTSSIDNIATTGTHQTTLAFGNNAFLVKFNAQGQRIWGTYFGGYGTSTEGTVSGRGHSIACDTLGNIYMAGNTFCNTGIATPGSHQPNLNTNGYGWPDLYLVKFRNDGTREWSTYYGNPRQEEGGSVAVTPNGSKIYLAGASESYPPAVDAITTANAFITPANAGHSSYSGFLACFNATGQRLWGTYLSDVENITSTAYDITLDHEGAIFLTGYAIGDYAGNTFSIASQGSFQAQYGGCIFSNFGPPNCTPDAFLQKWDSMGNRLWGTYYGGDYPDGGYGLACDETGNVYMTGFTSRFQASNNGPYSVASQGSFMDVLSSDGGSFLAKFSGLGQRQWATYYYGQSTSVACKNNLVFLLTNTDGTNLATPCAYQTENPGIFAIGASPSTLLTIFSPLGARLYATYYGGKYNDWGSSLATSETKEELALYIAGTTLSPTGIATSGSFKNTLGGQLSIQRDAFLAKFIIPKPKTINVPCFGLDSVRITARDTTYSNYQWNNGANGYSTWVKVTGNYTVRYEKANGCIITDSFSVTIYPMPELATQKTCIGEGKAAVSVAIENTNNYTYKWFRNGALLADRQSNNGDLLSGLLPGNYNLQIQTPGCDTTLLFTIENFPEVILIASKDTMIAAGSSLQLFATGAGYYQWQPEDWLNDPKSARPVTTPREAVTYTVTGYNEYGCKASLNVHIDINETIFIPNAFSPNGDGLNDVFKIGNYGYHKLSEFRIFNRWGEEVFSTINPEQGWAGTYKKKPADIGTYSYYITITDNKGKKQTIKGNLTLVR